MKNASQKISNQTLNQTITYSTVNKYTDMNPQKETSKVGEFIKMFENPVSKNYTMSYYNKQDKKDKSLLKNGPCFTLSEFGSHTKKVGGSLRNDANVLAVHGISIDIDNDGEKIITVKEVQKKLNGYFYIIHSTHSSQEKQPRFRVIVLFANKVSSERYIDVWHHFNEWFDIGIDPATKNVDRISLLPCCPKDQVENYFCIVKDGKRFDTSSVRAYVKQNRSTTEKKSGAKKRTTTIALPVDFKKVDLKAVGVGKKYIQLIESGDATQYSNDRSNLMFDVIKHLITIGLSADEILSILFNSDYGISERPIEKGIEWISEDIERIREKTRIHKNIPPYYQHETVLSSDQAQQKMKQEVDGWFETLPGNFAIKGMAGLGKTYAIVDAITKFKKGRKYEVYVPTHDLANQVCDLLMQRNIDLNIQVIHGRTFKIDDEGNRLCDKPMAANMLPDFGLSIYHHMCKSCIKEDYCQYLSQFRSDTDVRIYTHASLPLARSKKEEPYPDAVIIDETFVVQNFVEEHKTTANTLISIIKNKKLGKVILSALENSKPLLSTLRKKFGNYLDETIENEIADLVTSKLEINGKMSDSNIIELLSNSKSIKDIAVVKKLLKQLQNELNLFQTRKRSITVRKVMDEIVVVDRKEMTRFTYLDDNDEEVQVPLLLIDADYCKTITKIIIPDIKHVELYAERKCHVTQVVSTHMAKIRFQQRKKATEKEIESLKNLNKNVTKAIDLLINKHQKLLVVSYKMLFPDKNESDHDAFMRPDGRYQYTHLGGLRGSNEFEDCDAVLIIGRNEPDVYSIENKAAALWWDSKKTLKLTGSYTNELRGYRMENDSLGVWVTVCEDERSQMVLELIRECETLQAIDRIRLMRGDKIKQVYVMCNIPLDITVNKVVSLKDFCTEVGGEKYAVFAKAMEQRTDGVLPINPSYLSTEYDDVFGSTKDVNNLLSGAGLVGKLDTLKIGLNSDFYYILLNRNWNLIEFTAHGKSKKHYKAITSKSISPWITRHLLSKIFETNITVHDHLFEPRTLMNCKVKICNDDIDILKFKIATFEEYSDYINNAA